MTVPLTVLTGIVQVFELANVTSAESPVHYPVAEIVSRAKLSCVVWNSYLKSSLLAADYHGGLQLFDVNTRSPIASWQEHSKRIWSTSFSQVLPLPQLTLGFLRGF